ncbi:MAG TPA: hypothetical protein VFG21_11695 [Xanthomonadaceae bacterium]|nr:hypothetical protein [Xanthomonadaceae bacterium]
MVSHFPHLEQPMRLSALILFAAALVTGSAHAYTPSSGHWYNTSEGGTGLNIDLQDDLMYVTVYAYDANGFPEWYTALDHIEPGIDGAFVFDARLMVFEDGACVGCVYQRNTLVGTVGDIRIAFDPADETRAAMTWGLDGGPVRTVPITHIPFGLKRPSDPATVPVEVTKMLGEWSVTQDFSDHSGFEFPFSGDVLVFEDFEFDSDTGLWFFNGCRADNLVDGFCSTDALAQHDASGFYDAAVDRQVIVVNDSVDASNNPLCLLYDVNTSHIKFEGDLDGDHAPNDDGGVTLYVCDGSGNPFNNEFYPVRGFRSASRTFVETGVGPAKAAGSATDGAKAPLVREAAPKSANPAGEARVRALEALRVIEQRLGVAAQ